jgi:hypothetical protein
MAVLTRSITISSGTTQFKYESKLTISVVFEAFGHRLSDLTLLEDFFLEEISD